MDFTALKDFMDYLTSWRIPGNSISVCVNNKEVFTYQSGYENIEQKKKMTDDKLFNVFSCSKPVTAVAAMQLYEKGLFLLDDPVYDFIPQYKDMYLKNTGEKAETPITIRHLLTMTSGIIYDTNSTAYEKARQQTDGKMNTLTLAKCMAENGLLFMPGESWSYGYGLDVIAAIIEVITGKKFRDYVTDNIFMPLEMRDSYYHNEDILDKVAEMYRYENTTETDFVNLQACADNKKQGNLVKVDKSCFTIFGTEHDSGSGGITASVGDLSKFASALANGGVGINGERILSAGTIDLLRKDQLDDRQFNDFKLRWPQHKGYSYGLGVRTLIDKAKSGSPGNIGEFGWGGAAGSTLLIDPEINLSVFYTHHMLNPHEAYYQPRLRNVVYSCINK